jgi:hypothetical protein
LLKTILKYYSTEGYITTIKNSKGEEISLEDLIEQYFANPEDYFELRKEEKEEEEEKEQKKEEDKPNEEVEPTTQEESKEEKYRREQEEMKKWV